MPETAASANFQAELVACLGQPVAENPTGAMQEAAFHALGLHWRYLTIEVPPARLREAILGVRAFGMRGINLTIPHKVAVIEYLDEIAPDAAVIGAVNTVRRDGDRLIGENTDGKGFLRGVRVDAGVDPRGKRAIVLGAGGAARAIVTELALAGVADLLVVNRSIARGETMVAELAAKTKMAILFEPWRGVYRVPGEAEILVNATSIGLYPDVEAMPPVDLGAASPNLLVSDAVFNPPETRLLADARRRGLPVLDGLSMLVYQGVIGFQLWTGLNPPEDVMKQALRRALGVGGPMSLMTHNGLRGIRPIALLLTSVVASPLIAITMWSIGRTAMDLSNPCIVWGQSMALHSLHVGPHDPCREKGSNAGSKAGAALLAALVPGGVLAAAILAVVGAASSRPRLMLVASVAMLLETPVVFTIAPLTLIAGLSFLFLARWVPPNSPQVKQQG
jgi:shikimate dehydrogenase